MIQIDDKKDCCGCTACMQKCPKGCITMQSDSEGFLYPEVDAATCIDCGLCQKVCPVLVAGTPQNPQTLYAATNLNEAVRAESSSGGIFTLLAEAILAQGGVVFGARFNEAWEVVHSYVERSEELALFRGSKYTQSRVGDSYPQVLEFLKAGREVLFSGTPCQIKGLRLYLRKEYSNLTTVDFICHGVPSPKVWRHYLNESCTKIIGAGGKNSASFTLGGEREPFVIESIRFRDKRLGWKKFSFLLKLNRENSKGEKIQLGLCEPLHENHFMKVFLRDICLRPSCHACTARSGKSGSDIKVADFWGIDQCYPEYFDDRGVSWVGVMSPKGATLLNSVKQQALFNECDFETSIKCNPSYHNSCQAHPKREEFFKNLDAQTVEKLAKMYCTPSLKSRVMGKVKRMIRRK